MAEQGRLIENLWDCPFCGTKGIKGRFTECTNCGQDRGGGIQFYHNEINYVDDEVAKTINRNADWTCAFCNSLNSDSLQQCKNCGADRKDSEADYFKSLQEQREKDRQEQAIVDSYTNQNNTNNGYGDNTYNQMDTYVETTTKKKKSFNIAKFLGFGLGGLAILGCIIGLIFMFMPKTEEITVDSFSWQREIDIEEYTTVDEEGWSLPSKARLHKEETKIKEYKQVIDHYETKTRQVEKERLVGYEDYVVGYKDLGNGYSEEIIKQRPIYETYYETETYQEPVYRDEPVYATYYYYEIDKWVHARSIKSNGNDQNPYWGEFTLANNEREGDKTQSYYIHYTNTDGKKDKSSISYDEWSKLTVGQKLTVKVQFGKIIEILDSKGREIKEIETSDKVSALDVNEMVTTKVIPFHTREYKQVA